MVEPVLRFQVRVQDRHAHLFAVTLTVSQPQADQVVSLAVWIPGSYLVREFSRNLQRLRATQDGRLVEVSQLDKCSWQVHCKADGALELNYEIYALDNSVRTAWLDSHRGFFNGTSIFLRVQGQEHFTQELELVADKDLKGWQVATGLTPKKVDPGGFGTYRAADYDELVDCPVEMGSFWSASFLACGVPHRLVVTAAPPSFDGARLLADTQRICETEIRFWHAARTGARLSGQPPHQNYVFMLNAVDMGYGGLEHRNSTALICARKDLPRVGTPEPASDAGVPAQTGYHTLLGLISHEYFHTWNVKRLRPAELARYDYAAENYTRLLWFFEGFTSYYDDLLLRRCGLLDDAGYLKLLAKTINQVLQTPGRKLQSVAQASFDAWVRYYRPDQNTPNATVSYYTKGSLVALCLDLTLRQEGKTSLDDVMRSLWQRCAGGPMTENDLHAVLIELSGRSFATEMKRWVHGTAELPLKVLLQAHGVAVLEESAPLAQRLGLRLSEDAGIHVKSVLRGSAAERAGLCSGDEWLALEVGSARSATQWRLNRIEDVALYAGDTTKVGALVARDGRILKLALTLPRAGTKWRLRVSDGELVARWLALGIVTS